MPAAKVGEVLLSDLIGTDVHDRSGKGLGELKDVIVDTNTGRVHYAVLSFGGTLGIGGKLFAMPLSRLQPDPKGKLTLDADKEELETAQAFDPSRWPNWNDHKYRAEVDRRYGATSGDATGRYRRASEVIKTKVSDAHGGDIGKVKDMIVDLPAGRISYVVVDFDRAWNPNDKLIAVSMNAFSDGATTARSAPSAEAAAPPRNPPPVLALTNPTGEPTKGPASAVTIPGSVETRPRAVDPRPGADVQRLEREPHKTMTSYAADEKLVFKGTREQLSVAPEFDPKRFSR